MALKALAAQSTPVAAVREICVKRLRLPLSKPYKLAFGDVAAFDTLIVEMAIGDRVGFGEATILTGYTPETIDQAWSAATQLRSALAGRRLDSTAGLLGDAQAGSPFTVSMFKTAIEMAMGHPVLEVGRDASVPLLFGLNPTDPDEIDREIDTAARLGYRTLKVKVGFNVAADLERVRHIQTSNAGRMTLRIDGNQGYTLADAKQFATSVDATDIELLEQPCHMDDWPALAEVIKVSAVPIMLDESIYGLADIERAAGIGARFVKLKLMKMGSLDELRDGLCRIRALGMNPVLGNGVASDIGCWMEACVANGLIENAGEMNGFLRACEAVVSNPLRVEAGAIQLPARYRPDLDRAKIDQLTVASTGG